MAKPGKNRTKDIKRREQMLDSILGEGATADMRARRADREKSGLLGGQMTDEQKLDSILGEGATADMRARMADREKSGLLGGQMTDEQRLRKALGEEPSGYKKGGKVKAKKASKPKVRGAGKAMKGVRAAKMVKMKGA